MEPWRCYSTITMPIWDTGTALIFRARPPVLSHPLYHQRPPTSRNLSFNGSRCSKGVHPRVSTSLHPSRVFFYHEFCSHGIIFRVFTNYLFIQRRRFHLLIYLFVCVLNGADLFRNYSIIPFPERWSFKNRSRRLYRIVSHVEDDRFTPSAVRLISTIVLFIDVAD